MSRGSAKSWMNWPQAIASDCHGCRTSNGLGKAFNQSLTSLCDTINSAKQVSLAVGRTSSEMSQSASDLSQWTESQAATLEAAASAIE